MEACRRFQVEQLEIFGSAAEGAAQVRDYDFLVRFTHEAKGRLLKNYLGLAETLERILGRPIDLITERSLRNPYLKAAVNRQRKTVYERSRPQVLV